MPNSGDDFFQYLAAYQDDTLGLNLYVTEKLRQLTPEDDPVAWIRNYSFYRITQEIVPGDPLRINDKVNFARDLAFKLGLYPEYFSFTVMTLATDDPKVWRKTLDRLVDEARATGDHRVIAEIFRVYANMLRGERPEEAAVQAQKALEESLKDVRIDDILPVLIKQQTAQIFQLLKNPTQAETYYLDVMSSCKRMQIRSLCARTANLLAWIQMEAEDTSRLQAAEQYFREGREAATSVKDVRGLVQAESGLAQLYLKLNRLADAKTQIASLRKLAKGEDFQDARQRSLRYEATILTREGNDSGALEIVNRALALVDKDDLEEIVLLQKLKIELFGRLHQYETLVALVLDYSKNIDSLQKVHLTKGIPQLQAKMGLGLEQQKSALLQRENELQQQTLKVAHAENRLKSWVISTAGLATVLLGLGLLTLQRKNKEIRALQNHIHKRVLQRFLPPEIVTKVMSGRSPFDEHPHSELITILFADLVGFTKATDTMDSECVARVLNIFMARMTELVFAQQGTIDKFMGDAIMVVFGAPVPMSASQQAAQAIACARAMREALRALNLQWQGDVHQDFAMRIGIHHGSAIVGTFGSERRSDYTVIGRTVNIASRIENRAAPDEILFSETVALLLSEPVLDKGVFTLRGIEQPMRLFSLPESSMLEHSA